MSTAAKIKRALDLESCIKLIQNTNEAFNSIEGADIGPLLERIGGAKVVLLGEATHGTAEFYEMRARITKALVNHGGFNIVAVEADWPDAAVVNRYIHGLPLGEDQDPIFTRFPTWMWRNEEVQDFIQWLKMYNQGVQHPEVQVGFYGLDLYSLYSSIQSILQYLENVDPDSVKIARRRYGCLEPWEPHPEAYGHAAVSGRIEDCEKEVVAMLKDLLQKRLSYSQNDGFRFFDAVANARLVADAERYYRIMYYGSRASWNWRDRHMFETLKHLLHFRGPEAKAVVWEHNSHIGDASATQMGEQGEFNIGQLCRQEFSEAAYLIGFGTDHGTVAAASNWNEPMQIMEINPALSESYEGIFHLTQIPSFFLPLRTHPPEDVEHALKPARLERAIGVIYRPDSELYSHYFTASLPRQFNEYIWFDETQAVHPLAGRTSEGVPETFPFGL